MPPGSAMISIRSSSLPNFETCPRRGVARWLIDAGIDIGIEWNRTIAHVGAVVGTACHEAAAWMMSERVRTGEAGGVERLRAAREISESMVIDHAHEPVIMDKVTPSIESARECAGAITARIHDHEMPAAAPTLIEAGYKATIRSDRNVQITGTVDIFLSNKCLRDIKTGRTMPRPIAQIGAYTMILRANGFDVASSAMDYFRRSRTPPPGVTVDIDPDIARDHAIAVARQAAMVISDVVETGIPDKAMANPGCHMCSRRFCPAFETEFCRVGGMMKGDME